MSTLERTHPGSGTPKRQEQATPAGVNPAAFARYAAQCQEWQAIRDELIDKAGGEPVTAYQVTLEQKKRLMARGDRMVTPEDLEERKTNETTNPLPEPPKDPSP